MHGAATFNAHVHALWNSLAHESIDADLGSNTDCKNAPGEKKWEGRKRLQVCNGIFDNPAALSERLPAAGEKNNC